MQGGVEAPATNRTLYHIFSCTKAFVAAAVWLVLQEDLLRLDERIAEIIPEFGANGFVDWMTAGRRVTAISSLAASLAL